MMHSSLHLFLFKFTEKSKIKLFWHHQFWEENHFLFVTEKEKKLIKVIKGAVTSYFFKNARIIAPSCHICQGTASDTPCNRRKSEFGPNWTKLQDYGVSVVCNVSWHLVKDLIWACQTHYPILSDFLPMGDIWYLSISL